ncbi:MAG: Smr/MutS family protein [Janthinobacterium lividum]
MARRPPRPSEDDRRLWKRVTRTVTPQAPTKSAYVAPDDVEAALAEMAAYLGEEPPATPKAKAKPKAKARTPKAQPTGVTPTATPTTQASLTAEAAGTAALIAGMLQAERQRTHGPRSAPEELEPRRQRRLSRERDPIEARIDLHGFGRFEAEDQLRAFLMGSQARGLRSVLVITGQGRRGGGVIRASLVEWLSSPHLRHIVSGFANAHRRHGGDGAFYVTIRQR